MDPPPGDQNATTSCRRKEFASSRRIAKSSCGEQSSPCCIRPTIDLHPFGTFSRIAVYSSKCQAEVRHVTTIGIELRRLRRKPLSQPTITNTRLLRIAAYITTSAAYEYLELLILDMLRSSVNAGSAFAIIDSSKLPGTDSLLLQAAIETSKGQQ